jgi:hypothetical protein
MNYQEVNLLSKMKGSQFFLTFFIRQFTVTLELFLQRLYLLTTEHLLLIQKEILWIRKKQHFIM